MEGFGGSFRLGRLWGIDVKVHFLFVVYVGLSVFQSREPGLELLSVGLLFGSVFLHELGHCGGARVMGGEAHEVILWPLGGLAMVRYPRTAAAEFVSTAAGPAVNLLLSALGLGLLVALATAQGIGSEALLRLVLGETAPRTALEWGGRALFGWNLALFLFNVLPAYPMDGGRLFRSMLWPLLGWRTATLAASATAIAFGGLFVVGAVFTRSIFLGLIGAFVISASVQEFRRAHAFRPLPHLDDDRMPFER